MMFRVLARTTAILGMLASIGISLALAYGSFMVALRQTQGAAAVWTTVGQIPVWPGRWMLPLGFAAMAVVMIYQLVFDRDGYAVTNPADKTHGV